MFIFICVWLALATDEEILVLKNGKRITCDRYEVTEKNLTIYSGDQNYTLPKGIVDWEASRGAMIQRARQNEQKKKEHARLLAEKSKRKKTMAEMIPDGTLERKPITMNGDTLPRSSRSVDSSEEFGDEGMVNPGQARFGELAPQAQKLDQLRQEILNAQLDDSSLPKMKRDVEMLRMKVEKYRRQLSSLNASFIEWSRRRLDGPGQEVAARISRCIKRSETGVKEYGYLLRDLSTYLKVGHNKKAGKQVVARMLRRSEKVKQTWSNLAGCR